MTRERGNGKRETGGPALVRFPFSVFRYPALVLLLAASAAAGQTAGARLVKQPKPVYPETASKGLRQGNVNLIGKIDAKGKVRDVRFVAATLVAFVEPAVAAVGTWEFRPATRDGKPIEIAANLALRFRLEGEKRGEMPTPILGDLAVFPADASGKSTAPEGFPVHRGVDPKIRVEAVLDVPPGEKATSLPVSVEAMSPRGRKFVLFQQNVSVPAKAAEVKIPFAAAVGSDWEDGVWLLRFKANQAAAGGGQFWLAGDPEHTTFNLPGGAIPFPTPAAGTPPATPARKGAAAPRRTPTK
jgi:TonB family protein